MPFYRLVHTGPLAELVSYFFAADLGPSEEITYPLTHGEMLTSADRYAVLTGRFTPGRSPSWSLISLPLP
jgi:hypothetical protein